MEKEDFELTQEQMQACKSINSSIKKARKLGVAIFAKSEVLIAYSEKAWDLNLVAEFHLPEEDYKNPVPEYPIGLINGSGADDTEYFKIGVFQKEKA